MDDNIEIHILALAITLVLKKHVKLHNMNLEDSRRNLDRAVAGKSIEKIINLFQMDDWREVLGK